MLWLKRIRWKEYIALAGLLLLLVFMVCAPVLAAGAHERVLWLATPGTVTVQATSTVDATVTALNKQKLVLDVEKAKNDNFWAWTVSGTLLIGFAGIIFSVFQFFRNRLDEKFEREKQDEERFQKVIEGLGDEKKETKVGAVVMLRIFLRPGYEQFYTQTFDLAVAHLRYRISDPNTPEPLDTLSQTLITVFKESFPLARKALIGQEKPHYKMLEALDASSIRLDNAFLKHADLEGIWMRNAFLSYANLRDANLSNAYLTKTNLSDAYLRYANLSGARLRDADLSRAHLGRADLHGAYLASAHLNGAHLDGADLRGADLHDADLDGARLQGAKYNTKEIREKDGQGNLVTIKPTQWPQEFNPSDAKWELICVDC